MGLLQRLERWKVLVLVLLLAGGGGAVALWGRLPDPGPAPSGAPQVVSPQVLHGSAAPPTGGGPDEAGQAGTALEGPVEGGGSLDGGAGAVGPPVEGGGAALASASEVGAEGQPGRKSKAHPPNDYTALLQDPSKLGFSPDEKLFRDVYYNIRQSFVEPVSDEQIFGGLVKEVGVLLGQAKVPAAGLAGLDQGRNVFKQLVDLYGGRVHRDLLAFAAIQGMLQSLDDPYSLLMPPEEYRQLQEQVQNREFGGIGIYIELDKDQENALTVFEPIEGTPAYEAGLESGDRILAIDGQPTRNITLDKAQGAIRGPIGSKVVLSIRRRGVTEPMSFAITRGKIHVVSVTAKLLPGRLGYVRLRQFGTLTSSELQREIGRLEQKGARALVLDLRNNGGGYIDAAVGVVGQFTPSGTLAVYTLDRQRERRDYNTERSGRRWSLPVVVLVNRYSASASEITAGALRDHRVATLVGEKSFGKGSVQQLYPFSDDSALKLTIARFYSPGGAVIDGAGLAPDVELKMEPRFVGKEGKDTQLAKAVAVLERELGRRR